MKPVCEVCGRKDLGWDYWNVWEIESTFWLFADCWYRKQGFEHSRTEWGLGFMRWLKRLDHKRMSLDSFGVTQKQEKHIDCQCVDWAYDVRRYAFDEFADENQYCVNGVLDDFQWFGGWQA